MSLNGISRTDVAYVGPVGSVSMILASTTFAPTAYSTFVIDSSSNLYLSQGAMGDSFYNIPITGYTVVYFKPNYYTQANGAIPANSITIQVFSDMAGTVSKGWLYQETNSGSLLISPNEAVIQLTTTDPSSYPYSNGVLSGVRYQMPSSLSIPVVGYTNSYGTGLYGGMSSSITPTASSIIFFTFVQNSAYLIDTCNIFDEKVGGLPGPASMAQCMALSGNGYDSLGTCSNISNTVGFTSLDDCSTNNSFLYYYSMSGGGCGDTYLFTDFKGKSTSVISSFGTCDSGTNCYFDGDFYSCSDSSDDGFNWLLFAVISLIIIVIIIVIIAIVAAISKSNKKKKAAAAEATKPKIE